MITRIVLIVNMIECDNNLTESFVHARLGAIPKGNRMKSGELKRLMYLKAAEERRQITYEEIAEAVDLHVNTVRKYMHDRAVRPSVEVVQRLADYFGVPVEQLLVGDAEEGNQMATRTNPAAGLLHTAPLLGG